MQYESILIERDADVATLFLHRPERRNAINPVMIAELTEFLRNELPQSGIRALVLRGSGGFFCAGADLNYMRDSSGFSAEQNHADALALYDMFDALDAAPCLSIACVEGGAFGGGVGMLCCCDVAIAEYGCRFSLSELRLGLSPATISPFVTARLGQSHARLLMLTAIPFDAERALELGLLHHLCSAEDMPHMLDQYVSAALQCSPAALSSTKHLLRENEQHTNPSVRERTAALIAMLRTSEEGQEGLSAFLEKRQPAWIPPEN
ncbi:enoyl-CoA hydratase/isomerase family protein [bacterium]|nr:enoyl-CoA hydratase/isomerase family protein [bacterium]